MLPDTRFTALPPEAHRIGYSVTAPLGFRATGIAAGLKSSNRLDLGVLLSDEVCVSTGLFTRNTAAAAPVCVTRDESHCDRLRGVVVNSGNANACSGAVGVRDARRMRKLVAEELGLAPEEFAVCSTGVIGAALPMPRVERGIVQATSRLTRDGGTRFAAAIRTTDRSPKHGALRLVLPEGEVCLGFAAKGAGMISPHMATMLCFVTCDALVSAPEWARMVEQAAAASFNRISVDGQESTNDTVLAFSNGASGVRPGEQGLALLAETLKASLLALAVAIVADGEGATKVVRLSVSGARRGSEAEAVARAIADSPLVKAAFYGEDPNWGRVVQSAGQALAALGDDTPLKADVDYGSVRVLDDGLPVRLGEAESATLKHVMRQGELELCIGLRQGGEQATLYFSDLTHQYVTFNAEYTT
jgi:glutamate N-acetyltransferase / amino-acid N-acetyltransferase